MNPGKKAAKAPPDPPPREEADKGTKDRILDYMDQNRGRSVTAGDAEAALGITWTAFGYHMRNSLSADRVKLLKRGHYQIRGRR